ncbi:MAG: hypothetical protein PHY15_03495 [Eubacteriales bacterium]|nr:hypothetical protein [Eubacteriales bacterium]MDD4474616.1 hypothetical protein [Eubacteriales bacterium]
MDGGEVIYSDITSLFKYLPEKLTRILAAVPEKIWVGATEIRLRTGSPFTITVKGKSVALNNDGKPCPISGGVKCTKKDIDDCISLLSRYSLYTFEETIKKGYIPLPDGGRAGICGTAVSGTSGIITFSEITSVNLRIHRLYPNFAYPLAELFRKDGPSGTLVFSPPGLGKTSFLRSAAVLLSGAEFGLELRTALVDERSEVFLPEMSGRLIDVISGCRKSEGIELVTRSMSPQIIICDELSESDCEPLMNAQNSGVVLIASAHGNSLEGIFRRPFMKKLFDSGIFDYSVNIGDGYSVKIERI